MNSQVLDRIDYLQRCHPWMLEEEARNLLVSIYATVTRIKGDESESTEQRMDSAMEALGGMDRHIVEDFLSAIGSLKHESN